MKRRMAALICAALICMPQAVFADLIAENNTLVEWTGDETGQNFVIPAEIDGQKVSAVGNGVFSHLRGALNVEIEEGYESIGDNTFRNSETVNFVLPASMKTVGKNAFTDCEQLLTITLHSTGTRFAENTPEGYYDEGSLFGTGYITVNIPCTASEAEKNSVADNVFAAKGDNNFYIALDHDYQPSEDGIFCTVCGEELELDGYDGGYDENGEMTAIPRTFEDVSPDAWYYEYVEIAADFGILNGKSEGVFAPNDNVTVAEAVKIAACAHAEMSNNTISDGGENWYDKYVEYCKANNIIEPHIELDMKKPATRAEIAYLFSRCDTGRYYINNVPISDIPDVDGDTPYYHEILDMYNMGAAVGSDEKYTFHPNDNVRRAEAAAMITRVICYDLRISLPKG